ncbi:UNVERIFIED_CONTAM: hypothetical protein FKN15_021763 [Acipenser sinensis]
MEDRSSNNLRLVGLKEGAEGTDAIDFLTKSIPLWLPNLSNRNIEIMRAHRIYNDRSKASDRPRTLIFNLLRYTDHQAILQAARKNTPQILDRNLKFYSDYGNITVQRHRAFSQPLSAARSQGLQAFLLYPATLKVIHNAELRLFQSPADAQQFLDTLGVSPTRDPSPAVGMKCDEFGKRISARRLGLD